MSKFRTRGAAKGRGSGTGGSEQSGRSGRSVYVACLHAACGLLCSFLERDAEQGVDAFGRQVGCIDVAKSAEECKRFGGSSEGGIHLGQGQAVFSYDECNNGMAVRLFRRTAMHQFEEKRAKRRICYGRTCFECCEAAPEINAYETGGSLQTVIFGAEFFMHAS